MEDATAQMRQLMTLALQRQASLATMRTQQAQPAALQPEATSAVPVRYQGLHRDVEMSALAATPRMKVSRVETEEGILWTAGCDGEQTPPVPGGAGGAEMAGGVRAGGRREGGEVELRAMQAHLFAYVERGQV